jgi:hypothetical protein
MCSYRAHLAQTARRQASPEHPSFFTAFLRFEAPEKKKCTAPSRLLGKRDAREIRFSNGFDAQ